MALLEETYYALPPPRQSFTHFRYAVSFAAGQTELLRLFNGRQVPIPKSLKFANMDEAQFEATYKPMLAVCVNLLREHGREDLADELLFR
jgi:hypothetical protein